MTGFKITDAIELEDDEPPISPELERMINDYRPLTQLDRLFEEPELPNSQCNIFFADSWINRVFNRTGIDRMPSRRSYAVDFRNFCIYIHSR